MTESVCNDLYQLSNCEKQPKSFSSFAKFGTNHINSIAELTSEDWSHSPTTTTTQFRVNDPFYSPGGLGNIGCGGSFMCIHRSPGIGYIEKSLPAYNGVIIVRWGVHVVRWGVQRGCKLIVGGVLIHEDADQKAQPLITSVPFKPGDTIRFEESISICAVYSIDISTTETSGQLKCTGKCTPGSKPVPTFRVDFQSGAPKVTPSQISGKEMHVTAISAAVDCFKIVTGSNNNQGNQGYLTLLMDRGNGYIIQKKSAFYELNSVVYDECLPFGTKLAVENNNPDAWAGSITANGNSMICTNCDVGKSTLSIVFDGNTDGFSQAPTDCLNGKRCFLKPNSIKKEGGCISLTHGNVDGFGIEKEWTIDTWIKGPFQTNNDGFHSLTHGTDGQQHIVWQDDGTFYENAATAKMLGVFTADVFYSSGISMMLLPVDTWLRLTVVAKNDLYYYYLDGKFKGSVDVGGKIYIIYFYFRWFLF